MKFQWTIQVQVTGLQVMEGDPAREVLGGDAHAKAAAAVRAAADAAGGAAYVTDGDARLDLEDGGAGDTALGVLVRHLVGTGRVVVTADDDDDEPGGGNDA